LEEGTLYSSPTLSDQALCPFTAGGFFSCCSAYENWVLGRERIGLSPLPQMYAFACSFGVETEIQSPAQPAPSGAGLFTFQLLTEARFRRT